MPEQQLLPTVVRCSVLDCGRVAVMILYRPGKGWRTACQKHERGFPGATQKQIIGEQCPHEVAGVFAGHIDEGVPAVLAVKRSHLDGEPSRARWKKGKSGERRRLKR